MSNFSEISRYYEKTAVVQKSASEKLFELLAIEKMDDVLDLGCGPGHHTYKIRKLTDGHVVGIDASQGMIDQAMAAYSSERIFFQINTAEELDIENRFSAIFCNSAFQWFGNPTQAAFNCYKALRPSGRMAIQSPATSAYCPNFVHATNALLNDFRTKETFKHFRAPWTYLDDAESYSAIFKDAGFIVESSQIIEVSQRCTPEKAFEIFESGAAAGYLNPECYDIGFPENYIENARTVIARDLELQTESDGQVNLIYYRIYLLAKKQTP